MNLQSGRLIFFAKKFKETKMLRNKIFKVTVRCNQYYIKAVDIGAADNILTQFGLGHKDLQFAPGHAREATTIGELSNKIDKMPKKKRVRKDKTMQSFNVRIVKNDNGEFVFEDGFMSRLRNGKNGGEWVDASKRDRDKLNIALRRGQSILFEKV